MDFHLAPDIDQHLKQIQARLNLPHLDLKRVVAFRSFGSTARARARIWAFPRIWQMALNLPAHYCIEVIAEKFDHLKKDDQSRVLIHELMHIPKNFSGALLPHRGRGKVGVNHQTVEQLFKQLKRK